MHKGNNTGVLTGPQMDRGCDYDTSLTALFMLLIQEARSPQPNAVHDIAREINTLYDSKIEQRPSTYRFMLCLKKKCHPGPPEGPSVSGEEGDERGQDDIMLQLLGAIQHCADDLATIILCRLLQGYVTQCKPFATQRRQRRLLRLDAANFVLKSMLSYMKDFVTTSLRIAAIDALAALLLIISARDRKFMLKVRLGGMIGPIRERLFGPDELCTIALLKLACRCVRSPRNAQLFGKQREFATQLVARLNDKESTSNESRALKTARFSEILYFVSRNRKCKTALIDERVIPVVKTLFEKHFRLRLTDAAHLELCLISVACLRQFSKTKSSREELISNGALEMCEHAILDLSEDRQFLQDNSILLSPLLQLQDSLCALCMRCLPVQPFPISATNALPVTFSLPQSRISSINRRSSSKSPVKPRRLSAPPVISSNADDNAPSSDDEGGEEEEESFRSIGIAGDVELSEDEEEDGADGSTSAKPFCFSRQKLSDLTINYSRNFSEFLEGARVNLSAKSFAGRRSHDLNYTDVLLSKIQQTKSVIPFTKVAFPDLCNPNVERELQPLLHNEDSMKEMIMQQMARLKLSSDFQPRVVYDVDSLLMNYPSGESKEYLKNNDRTRIGKLNPNIDHLVFESRFESGNLRKAIQVSSHHYELILSPDINQSQPHFQWFFFEVSNNEANVPYTFEVINCLKHTSMFSHGMQPVFFSVTEHCQNRSGWVRAGSSVCYYRNLYSNTPSTSSYSGTKKSGPSKKKKNPFSESRSYYSVRFTLTFQHAGDVAYIAYHFPYTYSFLQASLECLLSRVTGSNSDIYVRMERLCNSLAGNTVPMLTITSAGTRSEVEKREIVLLSARVHPGECNASWMMQGAIEFLLSSSSRAADLREKFVFKLVPMLNPDGVINGSHRCSLAGVDLNRVWDRPSETLHPTVYNMKGLIQYMVEVLRKPPFVVVDFHGHSRSSNVFVFGNNPEESWRIADHAVEHNSEFMLLPELLDQYSRTFSYSNCRFSITKAKEPSARVVIWRQFGVSRVYTMEASYCGFDSGPYMGNHIGIAQLKEMGRNLCECLLPLKQHLHAHSASVNLNVGEPGSSRKGKPTYSGRRRAKSESARNTIRTSSD